VSATCRDGPRSRGGAGGGSGNSQKNPIKKQCEKVGDHSSALSAEPAVAYCLRSPTRSPLFATVPLQAATDTATSAASIRPGRLLAGAADLAVARARV